MEYVVGILLGLIIGILSWSFWASSQTALEHHAAGRCWCRSHPVGVVPDNLVYMSFDRQRHQHRR